MIDLDTTSPLVARVQAFEQLQRVQQYLFSSTYTSSGKYSAGWSQSHANIQAIGLLRTSELELSKDIARRIGAVIIDNHFGN